MVAADPLIISYSGIRGIAGGSLTAEVAARFGRAFGRMVVSRHGARAKFLLARDTRPSGPELLAGIVAGLAEFGDLVDLGIVPTPTLQFALAGLPAAAGLCVTASHNPRGWNGMKFFLGPDNTVLDGAEMRELCARASQGGSVGGAGAPVADRRQQAIGLHLEAVCAAIDAERVRARRFRVALDSGGGAGAEPTARLLRALGCEVFEVKSARESEPIPEHLDDLRREVVREGCHLGLAQDLDADRLALVTERGEPPGEESTLVLTVDHLLRRYARDSAVVVKNIATTSAVDDLALCHCARLIETPVGEIHLSRALLEETRRGQIAFGGEGNGGVIYPRIALGRDSLIGIALTLECLAEDARPLSERLAALPHYHMAKARLPFAAGRAMEPLLARIEAAYPEATVTSLDGLKMRFPDGSWLLVRKSNTEPVARVVAESRSASWSAATVRQLEMLLADG